jgi:excisionase family DNA binding protein
MSDLPRCEICSLTYCNPLLLTIPDAARLIALHRDTVWKMCYNREIESITIGRARRIVYADLFQWAIMRNAIV